MFRLILVMVSLIPVFAVRLASADVETIAGTGVDDFAGDGGPAVQAACGQPFGLVVGLDGGLYVCETTNHCIRRVDLKTGIISTVAGIGRQVGYSGDGGPATEAKLNEPYEVRFDADGNMFFVEMKNHVIRRVDAKTRNISTVGGTGQPGFSGDGGSATSAQFKQPHSIVLDGKGGLYVCDIGNHRIRKIDLATGIVTTAAGTGEREPTPDGAMIAGTALNGPRALDVLPNGDFVLALREGNAVYQIQWQAGQYRHLAGVGGPNGYSGDGGPARQAKLAGPKGVAIAPDGDIYLADTESHTVRVIRQGTQIIETVVGDGQQGDGPDGPPMTCRLNRPHGVFVDAEGTLYIGDSSNNKVRRLRRTR